MPTQKRRSPTISITLAPEVRAIAEDPTVTLLEAERVRRREEKQASRDADALAVASGQKSQADLRRENGAFAFPSHLIRIGSPKKSPR